MFTGNSKARLDTSALAPKFDFASLSKNKEVLKKEPFDMHKDFAAHEIFNGVPKKEMLSKTPQD